MCRAHRVIVAATIAAWLLTFVLVFVVNPGPDDALRIPSLLVGFVAAALVPVCFLPWLLEGYFSRRMTDYHGAFLAGWEAAREPKRGTSRHLEAV